MYVLVDFFSCHHLVENENQKQMQCRNKKACACVFLYKNRIEYIMK